MTLLDCGDVIYDKPSNVSFSNKIELLVALAITGTLKANLVINSIKSWGLSISTKEDG